MPGACLKRLHSLVAHTLRLDPLAAAPYPAPCPAPGTCAACLASTTASTFCPSAATRPCARWPAPARAAGARPGGSACVGAHEACGACACARLRGSPSDTLLPYSPPRSVFFISHDDHFMIKTMHKEEAKLLLRCGGRGRGAAGWCHTLAERAQSTAECTRPASHAVRPPRLPPPAARCPSTAPTWSATPRRCSPASTACTASSPATAARCGPLGLGWWGLAAAAASGAPAAGTA